MKIIRASEIKRICLSSGGIAWGLIKAGGREQIREYLIWWSRCHNSGDEPHLRDGIEFWCVGHNASHEFHAGVDADGKMYRYSCGGEFSDHKTEDFDMPEHLPAEGIDINDEFEFVDAKTGRVFKNEDLVLGEDDNLRDRMSGQLVQVVCGWTGCITSPIEEVTSFAGYYGHF